MGRKKGFDERKIASILRILAKNPDGLWLRGVAKEAKLSPSTVASYIEGPLRPFTEITDLGRSEKPLMRVIRLKPFVLEKLGEGKDLRQILKILKVMENIGS